MIFRLSALRAANFHRPLVAGLILLLAALAVPGCMSARTPAAQQMTGNRVNPVALRLQLRFWGCGAHGSRSHCLKIHAAGGCSLP